MLPQTVKLFAIDSRCRPRLKTAPGPPAAPHTVNKDRLFVGEQEVLAKIAVSLWARNPNLNTAAQPLTEFYQGVSTFSHADGRRRSVVVFHCRDAFRASAETISIRRGWA